MHSFDGRGGRHRREQPETALPGVFEEWIGLGEVEEEIRYWIDLARYDLGVAGSLLKARKYVYALFF
ncbi:MAG: hypothetical protein ACYDAX_00465 [Desulfobacteria bacterium]